MAPVSVRLEAKANQRTKETGPCHTISIIRRAKLQEYPRGARKKTVEDPSTLLDAEADHHRTPVAEHPNERQAYRSGHSQARPDDDLQRGGRAQRAEAQGATFASKVVERYRRRESSVEEAMMGCTLRASPPGESRTSPDPSARSVSARHSLKLNREAFGAVDEWRHRRLEGDYPYVYLDGTSRGTGEALTRAWPCSWP